jgi:hypothetical protein
MAWLACGGQTTTSTDAGNDAAIEDVITMKDVAVIDASYPDAPGEPPPAPDGGIATTGLYTFAIQTIFLGEADRNNDAPSNTAWKSFGYDLDGLVTDKDSTNVCTLMQGAPKTEQVDGNSGIDNSWGSTIMPIIQSAASLPTPSKSETAAIDSGDFTLQLQVGGLSDDPQQNAVGLSLQLFASGAYGNGTPAFDSSTNWPVLSTSVIDGQTIASGSTTQFPVSYVSNGTFVSGPSSSPVVIDFSLQGTGIPITIHDAIITFDHTDHADAMNGTIAGVIDTQEFIAAFQKAAGQISVSLCGAAFDGIAEQLEQAQDILKDGTNVPNVACDGISIGIGFNAKLIANPTTVVQAPPPSPDPCGG